MMTPSKTPIRNTAAPPVQVCSNQDNLPVYQARSTNAAVVATLDLNQCVSMLSSPNTTLTWIEIELGWIQSNNTYIAGSLTKTPVILATTTPLKPTAVKKTPTHAPICDCYAHYKCANFSTHNQAHACFTSCGGSSTNNWNSLDNNHDGEPCQSLP
jgi:hypothetical protein